MVDEPEEQLPADAVGGEATSESAGGVDAAQTVADSEVVSADSSSVEIVGMY